MKPPASGRRIRRAARAGVRTFGAILWYNAFTGAFLAAMLSYPFWDETGSLTAKINRQKLEIWELRARQSKADSDGKRLRLEAEIFRAHAIIADREQELANEIGRRPLYERVSRAIWILVGSLVLAFSAVLAVAASTEELERGRWEKDSRERTRRRHEQLIAQLSATTLPPQSGDSTAGLPARRK